MELSQFLMEAKAFLMEAKASTYAAGDMAKKISEADSSTTIVFEQGDYRYHDNYFGGEPYGGREVVFFQGKPIWMMTYYGWVEKSANIIVGEVYVVLQGALRNIPENAPYRGPIEYRDEQYVYYNAYTGNLDQFSGEEIIKRDHEIIYRARYMGGLINQ